MAYGYPSVCVIESCTGVCYSGTTWQRKFWNIHNLRVTNVTDDTILWSDGRISRSYTCKFRQEMQNETLNCKLSLCIVCGNGSGRANAWNSVHEQGRTVEPSASSGDKAERTIDCGLVNWNWMRRSAWLTAGRRACGSLGDACVVSAAAWCTVIALLSGSLMAINKPCRRIVASSLHGRRLRGRMLDSSGQ